MFSFTNDYNQGKGFYINFMISLDKHKSLFFSMMSPVLLMTTLGERSRPSLLNYNGQNHCVKRGLDDQDVRQCRASQMSSAYKSLEEIIKIQILIQ